MSKNQTEHKSPVDWYFGSYICRFVEIGDAQNNDLESRFLAWENTVIVQAKSLRQAYKKVENIGKENEEPYVSALNKKVQWEYLGVTELLPIYEEIKDGAEIAWASHSPKKLKNLKKYTKTLNEFID